MLTYNQIIKISRTFQQAHQVLKNFGNGGQWDEVVHNQQTTYKYPLMWMDDLSSSLSENAEVYNFRVSFSAPVQTLKDRDSDLMSTNVNEVKSDMIQCSNNFVAYWVNQTNEYPDLVLEKTVQRTTFEDLTDDKLTGCYIDIQFRQNFDYDVCTLPMGTPTPQPDSCAPVLIYEDGILVDTVASGGTYSYTSGGGGIAEQTMNGVAITDQDSGTTKTFVIRHANNDPVVVTTITDTANVFVGEIPDVIVPKNTSNPYKTGQTVSYVANDDGDLERGNGVDFTTLSANNYFGNTNRFTDILGGQTYADDWIIDWATFNQLTGAFVMWYRVYEAGNTWANVMAGQPYTRGAYSDCYIPNEMELMRIINRGVSPSTNYAPFNLNVTTANNRLWTSTTTPNSSTTAYAFLGTISNNNMAGTSKVSSERFILMRYGNISEL